MKKSTIAFIITPSVVPLIYMLFNFITTTGRTADLGGAVIIINGVRLKYHPFDDLPRFFSVICRLVNSSISLMNLSLIKGIKKEQSLFYHLNNSTLSYLTLLIYRSLLLSNFRVH